MADNLIRYRENQRYITRGPISFNAKKRRFQIDMEPDETRIITINYGDIGTLSSISVNRSEGITAAVADAANIATVTLSGLTRQGEVDLLVTLSSGQIFKTYLRARTTEASYLSDYGWEHE